MVRLTDRPAITIAVDLGRKATKQTNKQTRVSSLVKNKSKILELDSVTLVGSVTTYSKNVSFVIVSN